MKKLAASMIIKNEEEMLPLALDSIGDIPIYILDTGSSDGTYDIYKKYKNVTWKKYSKWNTEPYTLESFSDARNESKQMVPEDVTWVLILDGDEILETPVSMLQSAINGAWSNKFDVLLFDVQTPLERNEQPRMLRNIPELFYYGPAHNLPMYFPDGLESPQTRQQIPNGGPDKKSFKTTYAVTANVSPNHQKEPERTKKILEKALTGDPMNTRNMYYYIRELLNRQDPHKALYYCNRYIKIAPMTNERADVHFIAATCHLALNDNEGAVNEGWNAVKILPTYRDALVFLSKFYNHADMKSQMLKYCSGANNKGVLFLRDLHKKK